MPVANICQCTSEGNVGGIGTVALDGRCKATLALALVKTESVQVLQYWDNGRRQAIRRRQ